MSPVLSFAFGGQAARLPTGFRQKTIVGYDSPLSRDSRRTVSASLSDGVVAQLQALAGCVGHARPAGGLPLPDALAPAVPFPADAGAVRLACAPQSRYAAGGFPADAKTPDNLP